MPILVVVGWAGNDVHGDYGYQGCTWIHQKHMNKTQADRKVAAEYVEKQYERVQRSLAGLVEIENNPRVLSVQVVGNAAHEYFGLPPSYNREWANVEFRLSTHPCFAQEANTTISTLSIIRTTGNWSIGS